MGYMLQLTKTIDGIWICMQETTLVILHFFRFGSLSYICCYLFHSDISQPKIVIHNISNSCAIHYGVIHHIIGQYFDICHAL